MDEFFKVVILPAMFIGAVCAVPLWIALKREQKRRERDEDMEDS